MTDRSAKDIVEEFVRRWDEGDERVIDELIAENMVNHAAAPQGREGWKLILQVIDHDLADVTIEHHALIGDGDLVAHRMTMHGTHRASTMPLWHGAPVTGARVSWPYIHIWRAENGQIVEHWACRDDIGLLTELGVWTPRTS
ncbi:MAG: ester cyclase [Propionibacteriales bacterium]|nr:ester cyclase [Propionibacteriales bacterium]